MEKADGHNEQWVDKKLIELADYWNGMAFKPSDWSDDGVKIIRIEQLNNPLGDYDYYKGSFPEINAIHDGDLIFSWSATLKVAIWKWGDGVLNQHLFKVVPFEKIDKHFLYFLLDYNMPKLGESSHGSTMKHIKRKELETYSVKIPTTLSTQRRIAAILTSADKVIEQTRQLIGKYKSIKQGMMEDLLKPKEGWKKVKLGDVAQTFTGLTYSPSNINSSGTLVLRSSNIKDGRLCFEDNVFVSMDIPERAMVHEDDILICVRNGSRNLIGKCALITKDAVGMAFGAFMTVLRAITIDPGFLLFIWQSNGIQRQVANNIGATINQITNADFNRFEISVPDLSEQRRIAKILSGIDRKIEAEEKVLEKYEKMKKGLMERLLKE